MGLLLVGPPAEAQAQSVPPSRVLVEGEVLKYNVRYGPFDLGQVEIRTNGKTSQSDHVTYRSTALIRSYKGVPFVDLWAAYEGWIDSAVFARRFLGKTRDGKFWEHSKYEFDYENGRVVMEVGPSDSVVHRRDTLPLEGKYQDGISLFFHARDQLYAGKRMWIPSLVNEQKSRTFINFKNRRTPAEIDAIAYPVDCIYFDGTAEFVGIFGLTGDFEGWFSNDEARIPIMAKMKVILGSITLELMEWQRNGWSPPPWREQ